MENTPQNPQNNAPTPTAAPTVPPPNIVSAQPQTQSKVSPQTQLEAKRVQAAPAQEAKKNKRFLVGCLSFFGCALFLFLGVLFAFLAFGSADNPIFGFLGTPSAEVISVLITLVNLIFLVLVFAAFIIMIIGIFTMATAKKEDKEGKKKGMVLTFSSAAILFLLVFTWIFAYFYLAGKQPAKAAVEIATVPEKTTNLTAPVRIEFDASRAPINTRLYKILSYSWDFGDGTKLQDNPQTHTFTEIGNYKVKVTIAVKENATGKEDKVEFTKDVTIANVLASALIEADQTSGGAPLAVQFNGAKSSSPNGEITAYAWDLDEDGGYDDGEGESAQKTFDKIGRYTVKLRVTDSTGEFAFGEIKIEVAAPDNPIPVMTIEGVTGNELTAETPYVFSAGASTSPVGKIEKYSWDFGDGEIADTRTATHLYKQGGEFEVTLKVEDSAGKSGEVTQRFSVQWQELPPLPSITTTPAEKDGVVSGQVPFAVVFDASGSQDPNKNIVEYAWDFDGDGARDDTNAVTSHTYAKAGTFNATLTVTDSGNLSETEQVVVKVEAAGVKAAITAKPSSGTVPLTVEFDASGSSYAEGEIVSYEWDFGDGKPPRIDTAKVSYQYTSVGTFKAKVSAITSDNKRASSELPINVRPVSLQACFEPSVESGVAPLEVEFDPACSVGTVIKYRWNFANLGNSTDRKPKYKFQDPGEYTVTLEVADSQNVVDSFTKKITVILTQ